MPDGYQRGDTDAVVTAHERDQLFTLSAVATRLRISHNEVLRLTREQSDPLPTVHAADGGTYVVALELTRWLQRRLHRTTTVGGDAVVPWVTARERLVLAAYAATGTVDDAAQVLGLTIPEVDAAASSPPLPPPGRDRPGHG